MSLFPYARTASVSIEFLEIGAAWIEPCRFRRLNETIVFCGGKEMPASVAREGGSGARERIFERSVEDLQRELECGTLTSEDLVRYFLARIRVYDGAVNSIITENPLALDEARRLDRERKAGKIRGPLHGIPIVLKDIYDTRDMETTSGALAFKGLRPKKDAFVVSKLRSAGAIFIGKANLTELARNGMTVSSMGGQTLNPYDLTRTPGGSSGGTGAAVAMNFAVAGTGSDTVNSIRSPSSANSLVGIRATRGLVSRHGISPSSDWQDMAGPIARTVADAALLLSVMAGYDPEDRSTEALRGRAPEDYTKYLREGAFRGKRIALLTRCVGEDPDVTRVVREAVRDISSLGATVVEADIPEFDLAALREKNDVQLWEQVPGLDRYLAEKGGLAPVKSTREYFETGLMTPCIVDEFREMLAVERPLEQPEYRARLERNKRLREFVTRYMAEHGVDAFLYPLQSVLAVRTDDPLGQHDRNGLMASVAGLPAVDLPGGFSRPSSTAPIGVPIGIEFMAEPFSEPKLVSLAYSFEQATRHRRPPAGFPDLDFSSAG